MKHESGSLYLQQAKSYYKKIKHIEIEIRVVNIVPERTRSIPEQNEATGNVGGSSKSY